MSATPLKVIDLPDDILLMITAIINHDEVLFVGADVLKLLLTHRRFLVAAEQRVAKHKHYIKTYKVLVINAANLPSASPMVDTPTVTLPVTSLTKFDSRVGTVFGSPLMLLVDLHKDSVIPSYVRSLTYISPSGNLKHAPGCSKTPLELFGGDQEAVNSWDEQMGGNVLEVLPQGATFVHMLKWLEVLWRQDNGQGIHLLLQMLPGLFSLSLTGPERRWSQGANIQLGFHHTANTTIPSTVRRLSLHDVSSVSKSFHAHLFPSLQEIEIHCNSKKVYWVGRGRLSFLDVPHVKITGYRRNPIYLAVIIASASDAKFERLECTFIHNHRGGWQGFLSDFEDAFACP